MRYATAANVVSTIVLAVGFFGSSSLWWSNIAHGQQTLGGQGRGGRAGSKPGEIITPPDMSQRWTDPLQVGAVAPEFSLPLLPKDDDKTAPSAKTTAPGKKSPSAKSNSKTRTRPQLKAKDSTQTVSLGQLRVKKPVVLIFGSMTCPPFRGQLDGVDDVYESFKDRAEFLLVYIREAHPDSVLSVVNPGGGESLMQIVQAADPQTRTAAAGACQRTMQLSLPMAVDTIDNSVGRAYAGWPNRMVIVGTDGRIAYFSPPSPGGTNAERLRTWLEQNLTSGQK